MQSESKSGLGPPKYLATPEGDQPIRLGMDFFKSLNGNDKGYFGEKIAGFYLRDALDKTPESIFPDFSTVDSADTYVSTPRRRFFTFIERDDQVIELESREGWPINEHLLDKDGSRSHIGQIDDWPEDRTPWAPDLAYKVSDLYEEGELERELLCEVKTGPYAEFRKTQRDAMEIMNRHPERLILRARVFFNADTDDIELGFSRLDSTDLDESLQWSPWTPSI